MSKGSLRGADNANATISAAGKLNLSWDDNSGLSSASLNDAAMVVVYHPVLVDAYYNLNAASRGYTAVELDLPQSYSGSEVQVYLSFIAVDGGGSSASKSVSNSTYMGAVTIA